MEQLEEESNSLRARVDARYTANVLLGLGSGPVSGSDGVGVTLRSSGSICRDLDKVAQQKHDELMTMQMRIEEDQNALLERCTAHVLNSTGTGIRKDKVPNVTLSASAAAVAERRAKGKYTPQERETIRRERNRIHAKKTRDKKKIFLEASEATIATLEAEIASLRNYLVGATVMTVDEKEQWEARDRTAQLELATLKDSSNSVVTDVLLQIRSDKSVEMGVKECTHSETWGLSSRSSSSDISSNSSAGPTPLDGSGSGSGNSTSNDTGSGSGSSVSNEAVLSRVSRVGSNVYVLRTAAPYQDGDSGGTSMTTKSHGKPSRANAMHVDEDQASENASSDASVFTGGTTGSSGDRKRGQKRLWRFQDDECTQKYEHGNSSSNCGSSDNNEEGSSGASGSTDGSHDDSSGSDRAGVPSKQASLKSLVVKQDDTSDHDASLIF